MSVITGAIKGQAKGSAERRRYQDEDGGKGGGGVEEWAAGG